MKIGFTVWLIQLAILYHFLSPTSLLQAALMSLIVSLEYSFLSASVSHFPLRYGSGSSDNL